MDKKNLVIVCSWFAFGILFKEYINLVSDFKTLLDDYKENEERFEKAKEITTNFLFEDMIDRIEE